MYLNINFFAVIIDLYEDFLFYGKSNNYLVQNEYPNIPNNLYLYVGK